MSRPCVRCGEERPRGRTKYCSEECTALVLAEREAQRRKLRMAACARCGAQKDLGVRGGKYCAECRRLKADSSASYEAERSRRRSLSALGDRLEEGERVARRRLDTPDGMKWCARCQEFRPVGSFPERKDTGKRAAYCVPCQRAYNSERRLKLNFGLDWDDYSMLFECQDRRCAICGGRPRKYMLAVDHDHKTGEIRGLLCSKCNHKLLGSANDDPERLRRAADYLEEFGPREVFGQPRVVPGFPPIEEAAS